MIPAGVRAGLGATTCLVLVAVAAFGLLRLDDQVIVYGFGAAGPDARTFPRIVLWLLMGLSAIRLGLTLAKGDVGFGACARWLGVAVVILAVAGGLLAMPVAGFLAGAALTGMVTALAYGERRLIWAVLVPVLAALVITYGSRGFLNVPLP